MPETSFIASIESNLPFSSRWAIIFCAVDGPIPGNVSNSDWLALLMFTFAVVLFEALLLDVDSLLVTPCDALLDVPS